MKRYYNNDNMEQDPSRSIMPIREMAMNNPFINNNQSQRINPDTNNKSQSQRFNSDIDIKYITSSKDLLPKNNMNNNTALLRV